MGQLARVYVVLAGLSALALAVFLPPFLVSDEDAHALRASSIGHGYWLAERADLGAGAPVDRNLLQVSAAFVLRQNEEQGWYRIARLRPDGRFTLAELAAVRGVRWARQQTFAHFPNTAAYPPLLYLPQAAGWRIAEALDLTILQSLWCVRLLTAACSIAIGYASLRVARLNRGLLTAYLLLPTVMGLVASSSQDALLVTVAALAAGMLSRALAARRDLLGWELAVLALLFAAMSLARPPYLLLAGTVFLPGLQRKHGSDARSLRGPVLLVCGVVASLALWQVATRPGTITQTIPGVDPALQMTFVRSHPLAAAEAIAWGTVASAPHMLVKAIYSLGWNDIYPPFWMYGVLLLALAGFALCAGWQGLNGWRAQAVLAVCLTGAILGISFAEYLIWTKVGDRTLTGWLPRYYVPLIPFVLLWSSEPIRRRGMLLPVACGLFLFVLATPPWLLAHRYYAAGPVAVLKAMFG